MIDEQARADHEPRTTKNEERLANDEYASHQLEAAYRNLDRALSSVALADNKALIALTFQGAIVAGLALIAGSMRSALQGSGNFGIRVPLLVLLAAFFVCFSLSTHKLFQTISPRVRRDQDLEHPSFLFYWGGIAEMPADVFARRMRNLHPRDIHEAVVRVTHNNSRIAMQKFSNLRIAYTCLGLQMLCYVGIVLLSVLPAK